MWAGMKHQVPGKFSSYLRSAYRCCEILMHKRLCCSNAFKSVSSIFYLHVSCLIKYVQWQKEYMHCVSWEEQDGWVCQGRCPHVSQSAGRKLHWHRHTNTHIAHNIYTPNLSPSPPQQLKQYFLLVLLLTLLCFSHCLQLSWSLIPSLWHSQTTQHYPNPPYHSQYTKSPCLRSAVGSTRTKLFIIEFKIVQANNVYDLTILLFF